jgi:hypothetical protein
MRGGGRLFSVVNPMTTEEISRMGFTNVVLLDASRWRSDEGDEGVSAAAAASDIHYCFGMKGDPVDSITAGNRAQMEVQTTLTLHRAGLADLGSRLQCTH